MISFIIVNYKSEAFLSVCITSIRKLFSNNDYEIILLNNDSSPLSTSTLVSDDLIIIEIGENIGFAAGCNIASKKARGEFIFFLNPDTEILSEDFNILLSTLKNSDNKIGLVAPAIVTVNGQPEQWSYGREMTFWKLLKNNLCAWSQRKIRTDSVETDWVSGAAMLIKKDLFEKIGGFDENFFMYFEDMDLCKRIRQLDLRIVRLSEFKIKHFGGISFEDKKTQKSAYYKSQDIYFLKHFGPIKAFLVKILRKLHV